MFRGCATTAAENMCINTGLYWYDMYRVHKGTLVSFIRTA